MRVQHWAILAAIVTAIALQVAGLDHWEDALNPKWVSGLLLLLVTNIGALLSDKPRSADTLSRATDQHQGDEVPRARGPQPAELEGK